MFAKANKGHPKLEKQYGSYVCDDANLHIWRMMLLTSFLVYAYRRNGIKN